ncbi:MAG: DNA-processing protein DprA [Candidatus Omnitrophica bacterium]|nr:DNA-processing protein DprA [Candidatus Omnitrophota bacterium]MDE2231257.1 DNA-processing protein DprA [Candidatus Omnitrophota bacterium]
MTEQEALLVLNAVPDLGAVRIRKLMAVLGSALAVLQAPSDGLNECRWLTPEHVQNILNFSKDKFLQGEYNLMQRKSIVAVTLADENFPCSLKNFEDAPVVLYVKGSMDCLNDMSVALVGSRAASFYGRRCAQAFARAFVQAGLTVVSGLARGIDTAAHQGALNAGGRTIAVIGCGFNHMYPKENVPLMEAISRQGAVVSEFAFGMPPLKQNFPWRNRIISALALGTVVIEAGPQSGALITADYALAQNKDVFVLPSNVDNETALGSNRLIQDGACVALDPDDVLLCIKKGYLPQAHAEDRKLLVLSEEQSRVYPHITSAPVHLEELARQSGLDIGCLMNITLSLELKRLIKQLPGQYYVRN